MRAQPSYIRTIKSNENRSPSEYDTKSILHQIKYLGLQENIRVRRAGFAYRNTFEKMVERYVYYVVLGRRILRCWRLGSICCRRTLLTLVNIRGKVIQGVDASRF